jgi:hypothetical protein
MTTAPRAEGEIEQVLVALALVDLGVLAAWPDRFADAARPSAGGLAVEKIAPKGDESRRVAPELLDRDEAQPIHSGSQLSLEQLGVGLPHRHQSRLARLEGGGEEGNGGGEELGRIGVDQRLMLEPHAPMNVDFPYCHCNVFG